MTTLLLRLVGPMQSWGVQSRFVVRDTGRDPSKSGVIGLICAALGRPRSAPLDDLTVLRIGCRVDWEGRLLRDYHTAGKDGYLTASGKPARKNVILSNRYYLADAAFLVGLEGDKGLLEEIDHALRNPHWSLFLGRKAFVPAAPVYLQDGLREESLLDTLERYWWIGTNRRHYDKLTNVRIVLDDETGQETRPDVPLSFQHRRFTLRRVHTSFVPPPPFNEQDGTNGDVSREASPPTQRPAINSSTREET